MHAAAQHHPRCRRRALRRRLIVACLATLVAGWIANGVAPVAEAGSRGVAADLRR